MNNDEFNDEDLLESPKLVEESPELVKLETPEEPEYLEENYDSPVNNHNIRNRQIGERTSSKDYKAKQKELDENVQKAKEEKERDYKDNGTNQVSKNKLDHLKDRTNLLKAQKESLGNRVNGIRAKANEIAHPVDTLKANAEEKVKEVTNNAKDKVKKEAKAEVKKAAKFVLSKVPIWVWLILLVIIIFLLIIMMFFGLSDEDYGDESGFIYDENCEVFSIRSTSLTKKEFVEKATYYLENVKYYKTEEGRQSAYTFRDNLSLVYSLSVKNHVNPEVVFTRAVSEGFSPGDVKYNYWGLGCTNSGGFNACMTFDSFKDGLTYFIDFVNQYKSLTDMMSRYTYIGKYWYNPGGSGRGGCYYYPSISQYMTPQRASQVAYICTDPEINPQAKCDSGQESGCVPTNAEDQKAKVLGSIQGMISVRKQVFGLEPYDCNTEYSDKCTVFAQSDGDWGSIRLGKSNATMADSGCAVTSVAIGMSCANTDIKSDDFDAGVLVKALNKGNCFTETGGIIWDCSAIQEIAPSVKFDSFELLDNLTVAEKKNKILNIDTSNHFIILHFENDEHLRGHYVVYDSLKDSDTYIAKDPVGSLTEQKFSEVDQIVIYSFKQKENNNSKSTNNFIERIDNTANSKIQTTILTQSLKSLMNENEIKKLNTNIYNNVVKAGVGTRDAIVVAAVTPIKYLAENYGYLIPYTWGGGHNDGGIKGLNKVTSKLYGVDSDWGTPINYSANSNYYPYFGPDCSGWAMWVYNNAGINISPITSSSASNLPGVKVYNINNHVAKPGDFLAQEGHITVVVGVDESNNNYYIAHSHGIVSIEPVKMNNSNYYIIDVTDYLNNSKYINSNYKEDYWKGVNNE